MVIKVVTRESTFARGRVQTALVRLERRAANELRKRDRDVADVIVRGPVLGAFSMSAVSVRRERGAHILSQS